MEINKIQCDHCGKQKDVNVIQNIESIETWQTIYVYDVSIYHAKRDFCSLKCTSIFINHLLKKQEKK